MRLVLVCGGEEEEREEAPRQKGKAQTQREREEREERERRERERSNEGTRSLAGGGLVNSLLAPWFSEKRQKRDREQQQLI